MPQINIPHPSPRSSLPSASPIHLSSPSSDGWKHIISVAQAFSDRLSQLPQDTPVATNVRWSQRCRDKGIIGAGTPATAGTAATESPQDFSAVPPVAPISFGSFESASSNNGTQVKRRRGRPPGRSKKSIPPAIVAAKKNLRQISKVSDHQWGHKEPEIATESSAGPASQDESNTQTLRRSTRSVRRRTNYMVVESSSDRKIPNQPNDSEPTTEPTAEPKLDVELDPETEIEAPSEPRKTRKQPTTKHTKPSTLFFFTVFPKPIPPHIARQNRVHNLSFSVQTPTHHRTLTSDNVVMLCMRAKVRKQKRMREAGITHATTQLPYGAWLKRNLLIMKQRMERSNRQKGKQVNREVSPVTEVEVEEHQEQPSNDNEIDTSREQISVEGAGTSARRGNKKRKRKLN
ncbi:hypothetical protein TWF718_010380 [Orbilia javanica]|uniref:Uncharacterized protein n=1 Tax=Orbilia javanica TaxID=47235 RepID=A0AAN8MP71_9PEZI